VVCWVDALRSFTLKIEAAYFLETLVYNQKITQLSKPTKTTIGSLILKMNTVCSFEKLVFGRTRRR